MKSRACRVLGMGAEAFRGVKPTSGSINVAPTNCASSHLNGTKWLSIGERSQNPHDPGYTAPLVHELRGRASLISVWK